MCIETNGRLEFGQRKRMDMIVMEYRSDKKREKKMGVTRNGRLEFG